MSRLDPKPSRNIKSSVRRSFHDAGHHTPVSGLDDAYQPWKGTSRIIDRAARRRAMRRTWAADVIRCRNAVRR